MTKISVLCSPEQLRLVERLAREIWLEHYPGIISPAQIDYMLERGYEPRVLAEEIRRGTTYLGWWNADALAGFAAYGPDAEGVKVHKLYVRKASRGRGAGRALLAEIERAARAAGAASLVLQVNKRNAGSIAAYERMGFARRGERFVDIGGGFVMDDDWMVKPL